MGISYLGLDLFSGWISQYASVRAEPWKVHFTLTHVLILCSLSLIIHCW